MGLIRDSRINILEENYPVIKIQKIVEDARLFEIKCKMETDDDENFSKTKENLSDAKCLFTMMIGNLASELHNIKILQSEEEKDIFLKLSNDVNICLGLLDARENTLISGKEEDAVGFSSLSMFRGDLMTSYYSMIIDPLTKAKEVYIEKIAYNDKIIEKNKPRAFLHILYEIITISGAVIFGSERLKASGSKGVSSISAPIKSGWEMSLARSLGRNIIDGKTPQQQEKKETKEGEEGIESYLKELGLDEDFENKEETDEDTEMVEE